MIPDNPFLKLIQQITKNLPLEKVSAEEAGYSIFWQFSDKEGYGIFKISTSGWLQLYLIWFENSICEIKINTRGSEKITRTIFQLADPQFINKANEFLKRQITKELRTIYDSLIERYDEDKDHKDYDF